MSIHMSMDMSKHMSTQCPPAPSCTHFSASVSASASMHSHTCAHVSARMRAGERGMHACIYAVLHRCTSALTHLRLHAHMRALTHQRMHPPTHLRTLARMPVRQVAHLEPSGHYLTVKDNQVVALHPSNCAAPPCLGSRTGACLRWCVASGCSAARGLQGGCPGARGLHCSKRGCS